MRQEARLLEEECPARRFERMLVVLEGLAVLGSYYVMIVRVEGRLQYRNLRVQISSYPLLQICVSENTYRHLVGVRHDLPASFWPLISIVLSHLSIPFPYGF